MKAVVAKSYGKPEVLSVEEVPIPTISDSEILIKVKAASLNSGDVRMRALDAGDGVKGFISRIIVRLLVGLRKPKRIQGSVLSGEIVKLGDKVTRFTVGDEVYAMAGFSFGAFAEYCALPDKRAIALKPKFIIADCLNRLPLSTNIFPEI